MAPIEILHKLCDTSKVSFIPKSNIAWCANRLRMTAYIRCQRFLFALLIGTIACVRTSNSDLITTYREFKVVETPTSSSNHSFNGNRTRNSDRDVTFYVEADEQLEKLQSQAEELRDAYNELIKSAFGRELKRNRTIATTPTKKAEATMEDSSEVVGGARKVSADWVRAAINPMFLKNSPSTNNRSNQTHSEWKWKWKLNKTHAFCYGGSEVIRFWHADSRISILFNNYYGLFSFLISLLEIYTIETKLNKIKLK